MARMRTFARNELFPSYIVNALEDFLGGYSSRFNLSKASATSIQVVAGVDDAQVSLTIQGRWRYQTSTVARTHPGGAAGTYDVFVTAADNAVVNTPAANTDNTNYAFSLDIKMPGSTPTLVAGTVDLFRKVGTLTWDGSAVTGVTSTLPPPDASLGVVRSPDASTTNVIQPQGAGILPLTVRGFASQSANLLELQNSAGTVLARVSAAGDVTTTAYLSVGTQLYAGDIRGTGSGIAFNDVTSFNSSLASINSTTFRVSSGVVFDVRSPLTNQSGAVTIAPNNSGIVGLLVKGAASQSANLQEWQNSAGTVLTSVSAAGGVSAASLTFPASTVAAGGISFGADTNLYRSAANTLGTDGSITAAGSLLGGGTFQFATGGAATVNILNQAGDTWAVVQAGKFVSQLTGTAGGLNILGDTNLYRGAAGDLRTDGILRVRPGQGGQITFGEQSASPYIYFGLAGDTNLYRSAAGILETDGEFDAVGNVALLGGSAAFVQRSSTALTTAVWASRAAASTFDAFTFRADGYMNWGSGSAAGDVNLYRNAVAQLRTGSALLVDGYSYSSYGYASQVGVGGVGAVNIATVSFGSAGDVNFSRPSAGVINASGSFTVGGQLSVASASGYNGPYNADGVWSTDAVAPKTYFRHAGIAAGQGDMRIGYSDNAAGSYLPSLAWSFNTNSNAGGRTFPVIQTRASGGNAPETNNMFQVAFDGTHTWGPGNAALDASLYRLGVGILGVGGALSTSPLTSNGVGLVVSLPASTISYVGRAYNQLIFSGTQVGGLARANISVGYAGSGRSMRFGYASDSTFNSSTSFVPVVTIDDSGGTSVANNLYVTGGVYALGQSFYAGSSPAYMQFYSPGAYLFYNYSGSGYQTIYAASFQVASDGALKKNVETIPGALDKVLRLRGVEHDWKDPDHGPRTHGVIAQEVRKVLPHLVSKTVSDKKNPVSGTLAVDYVRMVPLLIEAIKELSDKVDALTAKSN
jgi:hypothetical protein